METGRSFRPFLVRPESMSTFPLILMCVLAGWAVLTTVLALVWGRRLRHERQGHDDTREENARCRAGLQRLRQQLAAAAVRQETLEREQAELRQLLESSHVALEEHAVRVAVSGTLDVGEEVGMLFAHVARVALAVRNYSAYTRGHYGQESAKARYDLLWLADSLHTLDRVGKALADGNRRALSEASTELLAMYENYLRDGSGYDSRDTFLRLSDRVPLAEVTAAVRSIVSKSAAVAAARPDLETA